MVKINDIPLLLLLAYGFVEILVLVFFITILSEIKTNKLKLVLIAICKLALLIMVRRVVDGNLIIINITSVLSSIVLIWAFTRAINFKVIICSFLGMIIINICEPVSFVLGQKYLTHINENLAWIITGLPHILVLLGSILLYRRLFNSNEPASSKGHYHSG